MTVETVSDLAEEIADWLGIYGGCKNRPGHMPEDQECTFDETKPFCCRQGLCMALEERMRQAAENEKKLEAAGLS